jgi:hypothetical protein
MARSPASFLGALMFLGVLAVRGISSEQRPEKSGVLPGEVIYPMSSKEVWTVALGVVNDLGYKPDKTDEANQILVTRWHDYAGNDLPDPSAFPITALDRPARLQLHVSVFPRLEPARVAVGTILELERRDPNGSGYIWVYAADALDQWFLRKLSERVGVQPEPVAATEDGRRQQSARLLPAGLASDCVTNPPARKSGEKFTSAHKLSDVRPIYPANHIPGGPDTTVRLTAFLTEHGTLINLAPSKSNTNPDFVKSALGAASLWRFEPVIMNGCPMPAFFVIDVNYRRR